MSENSNNSMETVSFRRFLSYIYAYEDDTKLRNVGFAKVEVRPPRVRFQITVNGILQKGGRPLELYLVDKNLQRIPVGQLLLQNGRGEYRGSSSLENLWDSGMAFSQVYGICLQGAGNRHHYYMTLWREISRPINPVTRSVESQIVVIPGNREHSQQEEKAESRTIVQAAEVVQEEDDQVQEEDSPQEEEVKKENPVQNEFQEQSRENVQKEVQDEFQEEFREEMESASELMRQQSLTEPSGKECTNGETGVNSGPDISAASSTIQRQPAGRKNGDKCMELWKRFCTRYPHVDIRPLNFNDRDSADGWGIIGKVCEVVRIRPNDIGRLPRNNWILAHNSFLQNAYNHHHQLILFRVENQEPGSQPQNRWFIGLPGDNSEQETLVAEVFGFKKYLSCKNGGFWYTEIMLG